MLDHKDNIKDDTQVTETEFDKVAKQGLPSPGKNSNHKQLDLTEHTTSEIEQNVTNIESLSRLASKVQIGLREVFDGGNDQLAAGESGEVGQ